MKDGSDQDERAAGGDGPRAKPGLADRVYHLLYSRISNGDYSANQKLPSEKTLADEFGVSRPDPAGGAGEAARPGADPFAAGRRQLRARGQVRAARLRPGRDDRRHPALLRVPHLHRDDGGAAGGGAPWSGGAGRDRDGAVADGGGDRLADPPRGRGFLLSPRGRARRRTTSISRRRCGRCASTSTLA